MTDVSEAKVVRFLGPVVQIFLASGLPGVEASSLLNREASPPEDLAIWSLLNTTIRWYVVIKSRLRHL